MVETHQPDEQSAHGGFALLFHDGFSLGVVNYVVESSPAGEPRAFHVFAPYADGERLRNHELELWLDTHERIQVVCDEVFPPSSLHLQELPGREH